MSRSLKRKLWSRYSRRKAESKSSEMTDYNTSFTKEELKIIGNLCETMKHWRRHNPEVRFPDSLYEQLENIQDKCTKAGKVYS
jgi:hypothetical protein